MNTYWRLLRYFRPYRVRVLTAITCTFIVTLCTQGLVLFVGGMYAILDNKGLMDVVPKKQIIRLLVQSVYSQLSSLGISDFHIIAIGAVVISLLLAISQYFQNYLTGYVAQKVIYDLRNKTFTHLLSLSSRFYTNNRSGDIVSRLTNDIGSIQNMFTGTIINVVKSAMMIVIGIVGILVISWRLSLLALLVGGFAVFFVVKIPQKMRGVAKRRQEKLGDVVSIISEVINGIQVVKTFVMERLEANKFVRENTRYFRFYLGVIKLTSLQSPLVELIGTMALIAIFWFVRGEIVSGRISVSGLIVFVGLIINSSTSVRHLGEANNAVQQATVSANRIFEILDARSEIENAPNAIRVNKLQGNVRFENVSFAYNGGDYVLKCINLEVKRGEVLALVGPSGSGKTTLVNLVPRLYDVVQGAVYIDDYDVRELDIASLRRQIGIVSQEPILFNATISENIAYGKADATMDEIVEAAKIANAHDFIMELPQGYDTVIGERGEKLSGGQKQRISIARAIIRKPAILILDEATSNLDSESEKLVQEAISRLVRSQTTLVIAHRVSTVMNADKIVVIDDGNIVELGSHEELMEENGIYSRFYEMQFAPPSRDKEAHRFFKRVIKGIRGIVGGHRS
ncbi:MAG: ABC transporter ATP-binding protein [bacterium]